MNLNDLFLAAENEIVESISCSSDVMPYKYKIIKNSIFLEVMFEDVEITHPGAADHEYILYSANEQAQYLYDNYLNKESYTFLSLNMKIINGSILFFKI